MTIVYIIAIMLIIVCSVSLVGWNLLALGWYTSLTTRNLSYTSFPFRVSWASFLWFPSVTPALSRTTCATLFLALPATADQVLAMDAKCGSSTRGLWDGPGTCNESQGVAARDDARRKVACDLDASPCSGHAIVCSACFVRIPLGSYGSASRM